MPADDLTDPAPATTFAHLDATIVLERSIAELGIYPAVDPLASSSHALTPQIVGREHYEVGRGVLGMDELSPDDKLTVLRARKDSALPGPAVQRSASVYRREGKQVPIPDTVRGFKEILEGKHDSIPRRFLT